MDGGQKANVLAHERAHLARRDHWWKPLGYGLLAVYWFNPVLWAAYIQLCRDIELACDEKVIRALDAEGETVEKLDGYYHYNYGRSSSDAYHSESYFYPIPDSGDYYNIDISWTAC